MPRYKVTVKKGKRVEILDSRSKDLTALLNRVGAYLVRLSRASFLNQQLGSNKWPSKKTPSVLGIVQDLSEGPSISTDRFAPKPALIHSGALRASVNYKVLGRTAVSVGSQLPYAALHQLGGSSSLPVPQAAKTNLAAFLKMQPAMRKDLGFLFRKDSVTARVPARPFVGVTPGSKPKIDGLIKDFFAQRGDFRDKGMNS